MPWNLLLSIAIAYVAVLALVYCFQERLVYYPEIGRDVTATPQSYGLAFEPAAIQTADGETLQAWWVPAEKARGTVLLLHGNAGNISHRLDYLLMFHRLGYSSLVVDYRGYGRSTGKPTEQGTYRDAEAAWAFLRESKSVRPPDLVIAGESLGGGVATWLAERIPPRALLLFSTFTSLNDLGAGVYWFLPVRLVSRMGYDNLGSLARIQAPVFIAHSRDDELVPFAHGRRLFEAARGDKAFVEMSGGHNEGFVFARTEWVAQLGAFLERHAGGK